MSDCSKIVFYDLRRPMEAFLVCYRSRHLIRLPVTFQAKSNVHINPKFQQKMMESQSSTSSAPKVHINPNFASRPLPQLPASEKPKENKQLYVNPSFLVRNFKAWYQQTTFFGHRLSHSSSARGCRAKLLWSWDWFPPGAGLFSSIRQ